MLFIKLITVSTVSEKCAMLFRREGIDIGLEHTAGLMRLAGVSGKGKGRSPVTTLRSKTVDMSPDLVR